MASCVGLNVIVIAVIFLHLTDALHQVPNPDAVFAGSECLSEAPRPRHGRQCPVEVPDLKLIVPAPRTPRPNLTFALLEYGDLFKPVMRCFLQEKGINLVTDNADNNLEPNIAEHLGELWMLQQLHHHPQRTMDPTEADVNILAIPAFVSLMSGKDKLCTDSVHKHHHRMLTVAERIENSTLWRSKGHTFFIASTYFDVEAMFTPSLLRLFEQRGATIGTGDVHYHHWSSWKRGIRRVTLPYKANHLADRTRIVHLDEMSSRRTDLFYHGCAKSNNSGGIIRRWLLGLEEIFPSADIKSVCVAKKEIGGEVSRETSNLYKLSRFCLVPEGDSPTSRRLFDSLGSGCVPVYVGKTRNMALHNLPFARTIDWSEVILFGGSNNCGPLNKFAKWFEPILRNETLWDIMSKKGREVYRQYLSYTKADQFVTAMLDEIVED